MKIYCILTKIKLSKISEIIYIIHATGEISNILKYFYSELATLRCFRDLIFVSSFSVTKHYHIRNYEAIMRENVSKENQTKSYERKKCWNFIKDIFNFTCQVYVIPWVIHIVLIQKTVRKLSSTLLIVGSIFYKRSFTLPYNLGKKLIKTIHRFGLSRHRKFRQWFDLLASMPKTKISSDNVNKCAVLINTHV